MARFILQALIITILASILELVLPWWSIAIAAFAGGLVFRSNANFFAGFLSISVLWLTTSLIIDLSSDTMLTEKIASLFSVNKPILFAITSVIGGLVGGFAAMAGSALRNDRRRVTYYKQR